MAEWGEIGFSNPIITSATVLGDIISTNWDGSSGPTVLGPSTDATQGYYLNAGDGVAQFQGALFSPILYPIDPTNNNAVVGNVSGVPDGVEIGGVERVRITVATEPTNLPPVNAMANAIALIRSSSGQTVAGSGALIVATYETEQWKTPPLVGWNGITWAGGTATMPHEGLVVVAGRTQFSANATGWRQVDIEVNGVMVMNARQAAVATDPAIVAVSAIALVGAGDTVRMRFAQNSGGNLTAFHRLQIAYLLTEV